MLPTWWKFSRIVGRSTFVSFRCSLSEHIIIHYTKELSKWYNPMFYHLSSSGNFPQIRAVLFSALSISNNPFSVWDDSWNYKASRLNNIIVIFQVFVVVFIKIINWDCYCCFYYCGETGYQEIRNTMPLVWRLLLMVMLIFIRHVTKATMNTLKRDYL